MHVRASAEAARAFAKYNQSETVIGNLCRFMDPDNGKHTWCRRVSTALSRLASQFRGQFNYDTVVRD